MTKRSLTGNIRHRIETRLLRKPLLVLQVEWKETGRVTHDNCGGRVESRELPDITYWEDARVEDCGPALSKTMFGGQI